MAQKAPKVDVPPATEPIAKTTLCHAGAAYVIAGIECDKREAARLFLAMGQLEIATRILCTTHAAKVAFLESTAVEQPSQGSVDNPSPRCLRAAGLPPTQPE